MVEFVQLTTECCWGQPSDPCQRGCLTSHACVMWGPRTLNADDDDDDDDEDYVYYIRYGGGNSTTAEEFSRIQRLFPNLSWLVLGKASHHQKLVPTFSQIDNCLIVTKQDFLEMEASLWLNEKSRVSPKIGFLPYMLLGSSHPYP